MADYLIIIKVSIIRALTIMQYKLCIVWGMEYWDR